MGGAICSSVNRTNGEVTICSAVQVVSLYLSCLPPSQHEVVLERLRYAMPNNTELGLRYTRRHTHTHTTQTSVHAPATGDDTAAISEPAADWQLDGVRVAVAVVWLRSESGCRCAGCCIASGRTETRSSSGSRPGC